MEPASGSGDLAGIVRAMGVDWPEIIETEERGEDVGKCRGCGDRPVCTPVSTPVSLRTTRNVATDDVRLIPYFTPVGTPVSLRRQGPQRRSEHQ